MSFNQIYDNELVSMAYNEKCVFFRKFLVQIFRDYTMLVAAINNGVWACEHT